MSVALKDPPEAPPRDRRVLGKLEAAGWGLFFTWLGAVFLVGIGFSTAMLGIAVITLTIQGSRKALGFEIEGFWAVMGVLFLMTAIWGYFSPGIPLGAAILIFLGAVLLARVFRR